MHNQQAIQVNASMGNPAESQNIGGLIQYGGFA
jgi:hypothetical protein